MLIFNCTHIVPSSDKIGNLTIIHYVSFTSVTFTEGKVLYITGPLHNTHNSDK